MPATSTLATAQGSRQRQRELRRVVLSSYLGATTEFYDFLLYATASALVFGPVFFSNLDPLAALIASYGTFAAGYLARPFGGALFGHFGDRLGRKRMLLVTMFVMGIASFLIAFVPPASMIGGWGAILLVTLRVVQGVAIGGEWGGAALMSLEHAEARNRGFAASFTNAGAPSGALFGTLAMAIVGFLPQDQFLAWGWRIPFALSALLLVLGLWVRRRVQESPVFAEGLRRAELDQASAPTVPLLLVLRRPRVLVLATLAAVAVFGLQVVIPTFAVSYSVAAGNARSSVLFAQTAGSLVGIGAVIGFGFLSDRLGRRPVMIAGLLGCAATVFPMFAWWGSANMALVILAFVTGALTQGAIYGPLAAFITEQFGTQARYTGASLGYQVATLLGAGLTPTILASLYASSGGNITRPGAYLVVLCMVSLVAVLLTRESRDNDLNRMQH